MTAATKAVVNRAEKKRHVYCDRHLREGLAQCPLTPDEKIKGATAGEVCEECEPLVHACHDDDAPMPDGRCATCLLPKGARP